MKLYSAKQTGNFGENFTAKYLKRKGYKIIKRNFSCKYGEIDIIAQNDKYIIFVEVKTRGANSLGTPAEYVDFRKQRKIIKTAAHFLVNYPSNLQPRFDISELFISDDKSGKPRINYIKNAFIQEGDYAAF